MFNIKLGLVLCLVFGYVNVEATDFTISSSGMDTQTCCTDTIQDCLTWDYLFIASPNGCLDEISNGDEIIISTPLTQTFSGQTYSVPSDLDISIRINSEIDCDNNNGPGFTIEAGNPRKVTIFGSGGSIRNCPEGGILVLDQSYVEVRDIDMINNGDHGVLITGAHSTGTDLGHTFNNVLFDGASSSGNADGGHGIHVDPHTDPTTIEIIGCTFENLVSSGTGTAISITDLDVVIQACTFTNIDHTGTGEGGAIAIRDSSRVKSISIENTDITFVSSSTSVGSGGGALLAQYNSLSVDNLRVSNVTASNGAGCLNLYGPSSGTSDSTIIANSRFAGCESMNGVGAIKFTVGSGEVQITNTKFLENEGGVYGGIWFPNPADFSFIHIDGCQFGGNRGQSSSTSYGAIYHDIDDCPLRITNSVFANNYAYTGGGDIYIAAASSPLIVETTEFSRSSAGALLSGSSTSRGGSVHLASVVNLDSNFTNTHWFDSFARQDGGSVYSAQSAGELLFRGCTFTDCSAERGGAIYTVGTHGKTTVDDCVFTRTRARTTTGGAIHSGSDDLFVTNSQFTFTSAETSGGAIFKGSSAVASIIGCTFSDSYCGASGGALYMSSIGIVDLTNVDFLNTEAGANGGAVEIPFSDVVITDVTITNSKAGSAGGGMRVFSNSGSPGKDITIQRLTMSNATSELSGGCLHLNYMDNIILIDVTGSDCTSGANGGSIYLSPQSTTTSVVTLSSVTIARARSSSNGGGLYTTGGDLKLKDVVVTDSIAGSAGGGAYIIHDAVSPVGTDPVASNLVFERNRAGSSSGGGLYITPIGSEVFEVTGLTIRDNIAHGNGGGFFADSALKLTDLVLTGNNAITGGGALIYNANVEFGGTNIVSGNEAQTGGGGLSIDGLSVANSFLISSGVFTISDNVAESGGGINCVNGYFLSRTNGAEIIVSDNHATLSYSNIRSVASCTQDLDNNCDECVNGVCTPGTGVCLCNDGFTDSTNGCRERTVEADICDEEASCSSCSEKAGCIWCPVKGVNGTCIEGSAVGGPSYTTCFGDDPEDDAWIPSVSFCPLDDSAGLDGSEIENPTTPFIYTDIFLILCGVASFLLGLAIIALLQVKVFGVEQDKSVGSLLEADVKSLKIK